MPMIGDDELRALRDEIASLLADALRVFDETEAETARVAEEFHAESERIAAEYRAEVDRVAAETDTETARVELAHQLLVLPRRSWLNVGSRPGGVVDQFERGGGGVAVLDEVEHALDEIGA